MNEIPVLAVFWVHVRIMHCCSQLNTDLKFVMFVDFLILLCLGLCFFMSPAASVKKS